MYVTCIRYPRPNAGVRIAAANANQEAIDTAT
jgi:hypothetical protein